MAAQGDDCYFYYYSTCSKGDSCQFRHCPEALGNEIVCSLWREGRCHRTICSYRHMEIQKNRSMIQCFWENQPSGCLKEHCPFKHVKPRAVDPSQTRSPKITTDVRNTLISSGSVPAKKVIPVPVVEPLVVTPEEESDETSSVEVSPIKKMKFPSLSVLSAIKEDAPKSSDGQLDFGIKTLSQIRQKNSREANFSQNVSVVTGVQPSDMRKIVSLKRMSSSQTEGDKPSTGVQSGAVSRKVGDSVVLNNRKRISLKSGGENSLVTKRKLIVSENEARPTRISLNSGSDGNDSMKDNSSSGIKSLAQIRQERLQKNIAINMSGMSERGDGSIKTLEQIRRERKERVALMVSKQGDAVMGSIENTKTDRTSEDDSGMREDNDFGIKSLDEIRKERLEKSASGDGETIESGVKSLEQIRRERIANRLGLKTDKGNSSVSATEELDSSENETHRTSVGSRLGRDVSGKQSTVHTRLGPSVKLESLPESGRKIQLKGSVELQSSQGDSEASSRKIVKVKPAVSNPQGDEAVVKPRRRVTMIGGFVGKDGQVTKDAVKPGLSKSKVRVGGLAMDGDEEKTRRVLEDSDESGNLEEKKEPKKRILIKRSEDRSKKPLKRRADRQIYQPPAAKSKVSESVSNVKTRLGQKAVSEREKVDEEQKEEKAETEKESPVKKRTPITFHTDATSKQMESENDSHDQARSRLSNTETLGRRNLKSGIVRIKPILESPVAELEQLEPQPPKKKRGGGLRERLLKQTEKFTVGASGGKLDSTSEKAEVSDKEKIVKSPTTVVEVVEARDSGRGLTREETNVELAEASVGRRRTQEEGGVRTDLRVEEVEQTVVSSSGSSDISGRNVGDAEIRIPVVGGMDSLPDKRAAYPASEQKSSSSSKNILPDSTNQIIPSAAISQAKAVTLNQPIESVTRELGDGVGNAKKESNGQRSKARLSITDDDLADLLGDEDGEGQLDQYEDDDDALLNELEDLINA